ncbi:MAG: hypothetical protein AABX40_01045 [Candidatus Hydrothermarchaeota archaeon]
MNQKRRWGRVLVVMQPGDGEVEKLIGCLKAERPWDILSGSNEGA